MGTPAVSSVYKTNPVRVFGLQGAKTSILGEDMTAASRITQILTCFLMKGRGILLFLLHSDAWLQHRHEK